MDNYDFMLQHGISESDFWVDYEKGKEYVDSMFGKKLLKTISHFYIWDCYSFSGVRILSGTTLKDIEDIFSKTFFESYYFACPYRTTDGEKNAAVFRIVRRKKEHERFLRSNLKFIPKDTYVLEWGDATATIYWPFIQKDDGSVIHLFLNPLYRKGWSELSRQQKTLCSQGNIFSRYCSSRK